MGQNKGAGKPGRGRPPAAKAKSRLFEAGLRVAAARGPAAATVGRITAEAGLGKGTFFNHFADKDEFWAALAGELLQELLARCREAVLMAAGAEEVLAGAIAGHLRFFAGRAEAAVLLHGLLSPAWQRGRLAGVVSAYTGEMAGLIGPAWQTANGGGADGEDQSGGGGRAALALLASVTGYFAALALDPEGEAPRPRSFDRLAFGLARGLLRET